MNGRARRTQDRAANGRLTETKMSTLPTGKKVGVYNGTNTERNGTALTARTTGINNNKDMDDVRLPDMGTYTSTIGGMRPADLQAIVLAVPRTFG